MNTARLVSEVKAALDPYYPEREGNAIIFLLFRGIMNYSQTDIILNAEREVLKFDETKFKSAVEKLKKKTPVQYVLGYTDFCNLKIMVDERVLIPRPETEEFVYWIAGEYTGQAPRILDVGTGSGCIAIALKKMLPQAQVLAVDVARDCIEVAAGNADMNQVQVNFKVYDVLERGQRKPAAPPDSLDLIVSNPPYIEQKDKALMDDNILNFEPGLALFVENGRPMLFYEAICELGMICLKPGGQLYFEINEKYGEQVMRVMEDMGYIRIEVRNDIHDKPRFVKGVKG